MRSTKIACLVYIKLRIMIGKMYFTLRIENNFDNFFLDLGCLHTANGASGGKYSGAKRRGIHIEAERSDAIYQPLWRTFKCIPAAGGVTNKKKHFVYPINSRKNTIVNFIISSKS